MLRTDARVSRQARWVMGAIPFLILVLTYLWGAQHLRALQNDDQGQGTVSVKLMPLPSDMWEGIQSVVKPNDKGDRTIVLDTWASMRRFAVGMAIVALGIVVGLYMGTFPVIEAFLHDFFVFVDKVPPLLLLPILFLVFDVGELSKVALVVIGVMPGVVLDAYARAKEISREQFYKAQTLGASEMEIPWSIVLPQILPKMLGTLRLNFKAAW
ncbi:MAG TPA: ABC transporter permease subunit, partial [Candidatus Xenobia bacterium]